MVCCSFGINSKRDIFLTGHNGEKIKSSLNGEFLLGTKNKTIVKWNNKNPILEK